MARGWRYSTASHLAREIFYSYRGLAIGNYLNARSNMFSVIFGEAEQPALRRSRHEGG